MERPANRISPWVGGMNPEMRLNSVVLPAPFGPDQPDKFVRANMARDGIDRHQTLEAPGEIGELEQRRAAHRHPTRPPLPPQASPNCRRIKSSADASPRRPLGSSRMAKNMIEPTAIIRKIADAAQGLRQNGQEQRADHGAGQAAEPAHDHHRKDVDQLAELELVRADEIGRVREQGAGDAREEATGPESDDLELGDVEPHGAGALIVLPHGAQRVAEVRVRQPRQRPERDRRHRRDHQILLHRRFRLPAHDIDRRNPANAHRPAREVGPVEQRHVDHLADPERGDGEIYADETHGRQRHDRADRGRDQSRGGQRQQEGKAEAGRQNRRGVGANAVEAGVPEREKPGGPGDEIEARCQDDVDQRRGCDLIEVPAADDRQHRRHGHEHNGGQQSLGERGGATIGFAADLGPLAPDTE